MLAAGIQESAREIMRSKAARLYYSPWLRPQASIAVIVLMCAASCTPPVGDSSATFLAAPPPALPLPPPAAPTAPGVEAGLPPIEAAALNAAIPLSDHGPGASPFLVRGSITDQQRSLRCLTQAVYYEAASEPDDGQRAVAQVVLNRLRHPSYPATVCGVVYQGPMRAGGGCQFTFTCDGSVSRIPSAVGWLRARRIAEAALSGYVHKPVGLATHYHANSVSPHWAPSLDKVAMIGAHIFYRWRGYWGQPAAFSQRYAGGEPLPVPKQIFFPKAQVAPTFAGLPLPASASRYGAPAPATSAAVAAVADMPAPPVVDDNLPQSRVRPEFSRSGRWIAKPGSPAS